MQIRGIKRIKRSVGLFLVNRVLAGTHAFPLKNKLLNFAGISVGKGTRVVGPIHCYAILTIGKDCWVGKNFCCNGNGRVTIGDRCDIAPEVIFQTGGHQIGTPERRAGVGEKYTQTVGNGTWIGGRSTIIGNTAIGDGCVIAGCACVVKDVPDHTLVGGVPAKEIRKL